ncbi:DUF1476 domain-containing protein [Bradyrhizobium sp. IC3069]|uniref:DUF1476 domain-containing protein n=1 Tax=Bradyrhizobium yuanmingense TaxID=108015 RepID=A0A1C3XC62_9BRAD|nr:MULTISPECIES: DUF1476 domain-containing protein [Bradyrhizobium]MCA1362466.1 DUF1476 domain-containing protein [Bradyrhizobium sp. IC4059]MCA1428067.1 DUF1476 domain-containing protein [Bradyrhizobium sp. NBAIM16]MCA1467593.1 DUF1476 domain-containing protein [Bradyrhizobium sp. IC3195]MCA1505070.1 DUF1476 domain-containing protein [Bradyrhizobium sp. NBAIM02]MCA1519958.1 DUF1476 domain-containing protein [Bradyrhizobium sp. IC3069]
MSEFDKRQEGFEKKYALDEEQKFKAEARRNRLLGLWAAEKLGITGDAAIAYAKEVVAADFEEAGDADVVRKLTADFAAKNVTVTEQAIRAKMSELLAVAAAEVKAGK